MQHVAIDLGGMESQVCVRSADGNILQERKVATGRLEGYLRGQPTTCSEAFGIADAAVAYGHEVRVVPATLVRSLGVGARGIKTDRRDAEVLSEVSCHLARERRSMCGMCEELVSSRTALINCVRGWARTQLLKIRTGDVMTFPKRVRDAALGTGNGIPEYVERRLLMIDASNEQVARSDKDLEELAEQDPVCQRLMSVTGVGPVTSLRFVAALDDRSQFPSAHAVQGCLGLTPGERSSSQHHESAAEFEAVYRF